MITDSKEISEVKEEKDEKQLTIVSSKPEVLEVKEHSPESIVSRHKLKLIEARDKNRQELIQTDTIGAAIMTAISAATSALSPNTSAFLSGGLSITTSMHYPHKLEELKRDISKKIKERDKLRTKLSHTIKDLDDLVEKTEPREPFGNSQYYIRIFWMLLIIQVSASLLMTINEQKNFIPSEEPEPYILPIINFIAGIATLIIHNYAFLIVQNNVSEFDTEIEILEEFKIREEKKEQDEPIKVEAQFDNFEMDLKFDEKQRKVQIKFSEVKESVEKRFNDQTEESEAKEIVVRRFHDQIKELQDEYFILLEEHETLKSEHKITLRERNRFTKSNEHLTEQVESTSEELSHANSQIELLRSRISVLESQMSPNNDKERPQVTPSLASRIKYHLYFLFKSQPTTPNRSQIEMQHIAHPDGPPLIP